MSVKTKKQKKPYRTPAMKSELAACPVPRPVMRSKDRDLLTRCRDMLDTIVVRGGFTAELTATDAAILRDQVTIALSK